MLNKNASKKNFLKYGSIISFMLDKAQTNQSYIIHDYDLDIERDKKSEIEEPKPEPEPDSIPEENQVSKQESNPESKPEPEDNIFLSSEFLYSQGVFNEYSFFYHFKDKNDLKYNYYNSLFLVLPKGEFDALSRLKALKRQLKNEYIINKDMDIDNHQISDIFGKFKNEIFTNNKYFIKSITTKDNYINFYDCVIFMHIKSGKFLEYKQDPESLKIYICLTDTPSENTIFRFVPAFNYQGENSATVMDNLILKIACGNNIISGDNEKFISKKENIKINKNTEKNVNIEEKKEKKKVPHLNKNILIFGRELLLNAIKKVEEVRSKTFNRAKNARASLKTVIDDNDNLTHNIIKNNFKSYINISSIPYKGFGKKIIPNDDDSVTAGNRLYNFWRLKIFSRNFFEENKYINSLDYFCIQNNEKNLFIRAIDSQKKFKYKSKYDIYNNMIPMDEENHVNIYINNINNENNNINNEQSSIIGKKKSLKTKSAGSTIKLNYFYDSELGADINYDLSVNQFEENDYIEPFGLFKFEFVYNYGKYGEYEVNRKHKIDILKDQGYVRLINIFTNKVLMANIEKKGTGNIFKLELVNNNELDEKQYYKTIFVIEKVKDLEDLLFSENDNKNQEKGKVNPNTNEPAKRNKTKKKFEKAHINKNDYIKIKSKKYNVYLGIRLKKDNNYRQLILTNAMSDLTKFKLNFLDDIDKYELHFFEQLLWSFNNIINYFKLEKDSFSNNSIELENYSNYVKIQHILITLEKKINNFPEHNKVNISQKNKFDFMKVIEYFNIVSKLIDIFLANWFHDVKNLDYFECEKKLEKYFGFYEEKEELTLIRCKKILSTEIFKILKTIYDLNKSYLNVIENRLLYFFMFIGRDDKCTKFLIYLLKNNGTLIISLCPIYNSSIINQNVDFGRNTINSSDFLKNLNANNTNSNNLINTNTNDNNINDNSDQNNNKFINIRHCLKRIMKSYNSLDFVKFKIDFSSVILLFKILNCLILYNQKPFLQFYDEYFEDLEIITTRNNETFPNFEQNSILVHFVLKNNKIFVKKKKFKKMGNESEEEQYSPLTNYSIRNDEFEFELSELISVGNITNDNDIDNNYSAIILSKLVAINLIFYSYLSLCNQDLKSYFSRIFNFDIVMQNYLNNDIQGISNMEESYNQEENKKINEYMITNDLKYSLVKLIICLYFRISFPFSGKMGLFYCLQEENENIFSNLNSSIIRNEKPKKINENMLNSIYDYICKLLMDISQLKEVVQNFPFIALEILECSKYILRNLFVFKKDNDKIDKSINLMSLILFLLDKFFGASLTKNILGKNENIEDDLSSIINDDINFDEKIYLITDNSKLIFEKYRKKLENIQKSRDNITKKRLFKKILIILSYQKEGNQYFMSRKTTEKRQKALEQLNLYGLSKILMELSTKGNVYEDNIIENILLMICGIFLEFLKYKENLDIENIFEQISKYNRQRPKIVQEQSEDNYFDHLINSIVTFKKEDGKEYSDYLEEVKNKYIIYKQNEGSRFNQKNNFSFFKYLKLIDCDDFKNKILENLYRQNSQKKIFYENITDIIIFETQSQYKKFLNIKDIFIKLFNLVQNLNLIKRLDNNSFALFKELEYNFNILLNCLIDERKWRKENNIYNVYGSSIMGEEENISNKKNKKGIVRKRSVFNEYINPENNINDKGYFISDFTIENVFNGQQTLYNLGFVELINQIFEYISWVVSIRDEFKGELISLESILISIYKLLVIFVCNNEKNQSIIREKLYMYICPLQLNMKSENILLFIGYFILNVACSFNSVEDFNQMQCLDEVISSINTLKDIDWKKNKEIIPFYVQTLKIIISFCSYEDFSLLYPVLEKINFTLINEIKNNTETKEDILALIKILELIMTEQRKRSNDIKNTLILSLRLIIYSFLDLMNLIKQNNIKKYLKLFKIFVIVTNLLYEHYSLYKNELLIHKIYRSDLTKTLTTFCNSFNLTNDMIYCLASKDNNNLRNLNEFIGISLPKLYIILSSFENSSSNSDDSIFCTIQLANELYEKILYMHEKNPKEYIFLNKHMEEEIDDILNQLGSELIYLSIIRKKIILRKKLNIPKVIRMLIRRKSLINQKQMKEELRDEHFSVIWNKIREKINHNDGLVNFQNLVKYEINNERMNYIKFLMSFFDELMLIGESKEENKEINDLISAYFDTYIDSIKDSYGKNCINYKNQIYFFYWTNIHIMRYNRNKQRFIDDEHLFDINNLNERENITDINEDNKNMINYFDYSITPYNKTFFENLNFIEMTIRQFGSKNINSTNYMYLLYIKFLNSYLDELEPEKLEQFFKFFINQEETENIFSYMKIILDSLYNDINIFTSKDENKKVIKEKKITSSLFENDINKYELIIQFITKLSANNDGTENTMKNYLRFQYNNSKSYNFIVILSNILVNFTKDSSTILYINKYYSLVIQIIECLTKCCNGPSLENQDCIVNETKILEFIKNIIKKITYREIKYDDSGLYINSGFDRYHAEVISENIDENSINANDEKKEPDLIIDECAHVGISRNKLSFLKYKLIYFLCILTIGRKKGDNIFELIYKVIDFNVLAFVLIETYKEILIEKESQAHHESLIFGEDMLQRMEKKIEPDYDINENFIIFEIGTHTFILINLYIENLSWIMDYQIVNILTLLNKDLKEKEYGDKESRFFDPIIYFGRSFYNCFRSLCIKCGHCLTKNSHEDFYLKDSFFCAYRFYYQYTPHIELMSGDHLMKYYVKLSPICKCLTEEMKEEFHSKVDRSSEKAKIESLFENVDYFHYILVHAKRRLDLLRTMPFLDLLFNHYKFYRNVFMIIGFLQNVLIFCSLYRTNDDYMEVTEYSSDFNYDYGFLYKSKYINITRNIFFASTIIQCILSCLILLTYAICNFPRYLFFEISEKEIIKYYDSDVEKENYLKERDYTQSENFCLYDYQKKRANIKLYQKIISFFRNLISDGMLFYHILMLVICLVAAITQNYRYLSFLIAEIISHSHSLKNIVKSFWVPRGSLIMTFILFYLIAYYFIIFVYLFIPQQLPTRDCFVFSDCFFTLCDQTIKNSNGIINYLVEEGLYITHTLYSNPRFWIDNWFAIIDVMLVLPMACAIIINSYISLMEDQRKTEKDKKTICFICGLKKPELNKLYFHEKGFYEHIKSDHYLWNYMFSIFSIIKKNPKHLINVDKYILDNYKQGVYSWVPFKDCCKKNEVKGMNIKEENENEESEEDESDD